MQSTLSHAITVFLGFFAIMNPIANVPIFLGLTSDDDKQTSSAVAFRPCSCRSSSWRSSPSPGSSSSTPSA